MQDAYAQVMERSLAWVMDQKTQFALPAADDPRFIDLVKPLGELALTADIVLSRSASSSSLRSAGEGLLGYCWEQLKEGALLRQMVVEHPDLIVVAALYPVFQRQGLRSEGFERTIAGIIRLRAVAALELPAWRGLELATACQALGIESPWERAAALRGTWLYAMPEPWLMSDAAAYSVTHTVFYETGFGSAPLRLPDELRDYLALWLPVWTRHYDNVRNYDLLAEMVMVGRCLGLPHADRWGDSLRDWQEPDGMLRGPVIRHGLDPAEGDQRRRRFLDNYHTTLVGLMASVMSVYPHPGAVNT